jgi:ABC-type phosphate/phosphonate transport system substrate-binding protein
MIAALPLYDWPELRAETDAFWAALAGRLRARGFDAPEALDRSYRAVQDSGEVLFAQVCGLPWVRRAAPSARLVGTPCYDIEGCEGPAYSSAIIVRKGDARGARALREGVVAANDDGSMSGWLSILAEIGGAPPRVLWSGAHRASVVAVAEGRADAAAIDALAFDLAKRFEPEAIAAVEVAGWTRRLPAPTYYTAQTDGHSLARIRAALEETLADPALAPVLKALRLTGVRWLEEADYDPIRALAAEYGAHLGPL